MYSSLYSNLTSMSMVDFFVFGSVSHTPQNQLELVFHRDTYYFHWGLLLTTWLELVLSTHTHIHTHHTHEHPYQLLSIWSLAESDLREGECQGDYCHLVFPASLTQSQTLTWYCRVNVCKMPKGRTYFCFIHLFMSICLVTPQLE